jgi:hypothetical protein
MFTFDKYMITNRHRQTDYFDYGKALLVMFTGINN